MSKIKLPHASGNSMSIAAPATNPASDLTLTLPTTIGTVGQVLSVDGSGNLVWTDNGPVWFARQASVQNISNNTQTIITNLTNDQVTYGTGWNGSTGTFTVPSGLGGMYYVYGAVGIDDLNSDERIHVKFKKNGAESAWVGSIHSHGNADDIMMAQITGLYSLSAGDTMNLNVWHNEGGTQETETSRTWFGGYRLIGG